MAITDIAAYAHLSEADIEALGYELDAIRRDIEESLGEKRRGLHPAHHQVPTDARRRGAPAHRLQPVTGRLGSWGPRRWRLRRVSRTWRSATTSSMANGIG